MPLTFLSGVFYSIHSLPPFWQALSRFNPFFYMIDGFRYGFFGLSDVPPCVEPRDRRRAAASLLVGADARAAAARLEAAALTDAISTARSPMVTAESIETLDRRAVSPASTSRCAATATTGRR